MAPPIGNTNALTHGMAAGALPPGCGHITKATKALRSSLQHAVVAARGEVSITDAAAINTAIRYERLAMLAQRWLRLSSDTMSHDQRLSYAREVARASAERDKAIRSLRLAREDQDPMKALQAEWATWEEQQQATAEPSQPHAIATETPETASETPNAAEASSEPPTHPDAMHDPDPFGPHS